MSIYSDIGLSTTESVASSASASTKKMGNYNLTQTDFLSLLTTELAFQDPTNPTDNNEMVSQLSQISTVDGINNLNATVSGLSDVVTSQQALLVSGLVGQSVLLDKNTGYSSGTGFAGVVNTGDIGASNIVISVLNQAGAVVYQAEADGTYDGNVPFAWDGTDGNGNQLPAGYYTIMSNGLVNGEFQALGSQVYGKVQSVVLGSGSSGTTLNVEGLGSVTLGEVLEVAS